MKGISRKGSANRKQKKKTSTKIEGGCRYASKSPNSRSRPDFHHGLKPSGLGQESAKRQEKMAAERIAESSDLVGGKKKHPVGTKKILRREGGGVIT